ncbi:unknown [Prevotella sp. CAG:732]|nr:unknown [Prevotella sp. CAG:732]
MQKDSVLERSYINDFHRQNSMGALKEAQSMLLHPYSREQKLAQINSLRQNNRIKK